MTKTAEAQALTLEDIEERVDTLEAYPDMVPMVLESGYLHKLQADAQHMVADAASNLMTGIRWKKEQLEYLKAYGVYERVLGMVALHLADEAFADTDDTGEVKRVVLDYLSQSKTEMVAQDYQMRLKKSRLERIKQWFAHHKRSRFLGATAMSAATTSGIFYAIDHFADDVTPSLPKVAGFGGLMFFAANQTLKSLTRTGPTKAGAALGKKFNSSMGVYDVKLDTTADNSVSIEDLPTRYADKHLTTPLGALSMYLASYDARGVGAEGDFGDMIGNALGISEESLINSYEIRLDKLFKHRKASE